MKKIEYKFNKALNRFVLYITKKDGSLTTMYSEAVINLDREDC